MKRTIRQYPLMLTNLQDIVMPDGAEILTVQVQHGALCLLALVVDTPAPLVERVIRIVGSTACAGNAMGRCGGRSSEINATGQLAYIASAQDGDIVWHVFEEVVR